MDVERLVGAAVRLGERQLPAIWVLHRQVFHVLDHTPVPELYLTQFPIANAAAIGSGRPMVVVNSKAVEVFDEG